MRFRYPEEKGKNFLRMIPVMFFFFAVPATGFAVYEYFAGLEENSTRMLILLGFTAYFGFRSWYTVKLFIIRDGEEK